MNSKLFEALGNHSVTPDHKSREYIRNVIRSAWDLARRENAPNASSTCQSSVMAASLCFLDATTRTMLIGNQRDADLFIELNYRAQNTYANLVKVDTVSAKTRERLVAVWRASVDPFAVA